MKKMNEMKITGDLVSDSAKARRQFHKLTHPCCNMNVSPPLPILNDYPSSVDVIRSDNQLCDTMLAFPVEQGLGRRDNVRIWPGNSNRGRNQALGRRT